MITVLAGNPSVDRIYTVETLRVGQIHRPAGVVMLAGGKGMNVARAIRALGGDSHLLAVLGGPSGRWIADSLAQEGLTGTFVWSSSNTRASFSVAQSSRPGGSLTEFYEHAHPVAKPVWSELERGLAERLADTSVLCLSGGLIAGAPVDAYRRAVELAHAAGRTVALDSHGEAFTAALEAQPELVKVNATEAAQTLGLELPPHDRLPWAAAAAAELRDRAGGRGACVVTCGVDGMALVDETGARYHGFLSSTGPYPVGSGDAVLAALAVERARGRSWPVALRSALGAGAANAWIAGAGMLDPERASELARRATMRRVAA